MQPSTQDPPELQLVSELWLHMREKETDRTETFGMDARYISVLCSHIMNGDTSNVALF